MFANAQRISDWTIQSGGTNYQVGDQVLVPTDSPQLFCNGQLQVLTVDANGGVLTLAPLNYGGWSIPPANPVSILSGAGAGAALNLTYTLYWQNVAWTTPSTDGLATLLSATVAAPLNELLPDGATKRGDYNVKMAVGLIRGAIRTARRTPLSLTEGTVPPEAESHCYALALQMLIGSNPNLAKYAISVGGSSKPPLALLIEAAQEWLKSVREGKAVEYPSDPDPAFRTAVIEGAMSQTEDLSTFSAPNYFNTPQNGWGQIGQP